MIETPSLGIRLNQYIQNLKLEILQICGECRSLFAHRAKIMYLSKYIHELFKQFSISSTDQRIASPSEEIHFRQLMYILCDIRALINNYITEQNFVHFVLNQPLDDVEKSLSDLKKEFDEHFYALLSNELKNKINFKFDNDEYEQCKFEDYGVLSQRLTNLTLETKTYESKRVELIEIINKRLSNSEISTSSTKTKKIYTEKEINDTLKNFKEYQINRDDYIKLGTKHYGSYSKVYTGINKKNGRIVAIKVLNGMYPSEAEFFHFKEYLSFFTAVKHPSVLSLVGFSSHPLPLLYITEYMSGGSLSSRLHDQYRQLDPSKQTIIALGIARGMQYIHSQGYIHRDLNSSSILLDEDDHPFISDFKLISHMKKGNMAIQHITSWTAPEMMIGSEYDQKVDVYSFGIILWEILTREVPFRGLSPFAIAHEVCESDSRPLIPQNCPPKLAKLIQACWHKNPRKRPDFNDIVYSFESGKIYFLGTSSGPIISYSRLFKGILYDQVTNQLSDYFSYDESTSEIKDEEECKNEPNLAARKRTIPSPREKAKKDEINIFDDDNIKVQLKIEEAINKFSNFSFDQMISLISSNPIALVNLLSRDLSHSEISQILTMKTFPKSLTRSVEVCEYPDFMNSLTSFFNTAISEKICDVYVFQGKPYLSILMRLFKKFGSTHVSNFVDVIDYLFGIEASLDFSFSLECFKSLSPFLISHYFETRKKITIFLNKVINQNAYDKKYSLIPIIPNLLENLKPEMPDDLLAPSLKLCESLCSIQAPLSFMIKYDAANAIVPLCLVSNDKISSQALHLINKILSNSKPSENFIQNYLSKFANFQFDSASSQAIEPLIVLTHLVKTPEFIHLFIDSNEAISTYSSYLESKDETVLSFALRLTFSLISLHKKPANFSIIGKQLISCLSNSNKLISMMASACLTSIVSSITDNFELFFTDSLLNYFKTSLDLNNASHDHLVNEGETRVCICALKLAGAFSMTFEGATFLHENSIVELIIKFLKYHDYRFLALTVLTSQSLQIPYSVALTKSLSIVIDKLRKCYKIKNQANDNEEEEEEEDNDYYESDSESDDNTNPQKIIEILKFKLLAMNFIGNVIVCPKAASIAARSIIDILHFAKDEDPRVKHQIAKIIQIIIAAHETRDLVDYRDVISLTIKTFLPLLDDENIAADAYKIFEILTTLDFGHQFLSDYINVFKEKLALMKTSMAERSSCIRLIARLSH